jgi:hypothetical protein
VPDGEEIKWKPARKTFLATAGGDVVGELRQRMLQAAIGLGNIPTAKDSDQGG